MGDDRTLAPMAHDTILPMIRTLHALQERAGAKERTAERGDAGGVVEYHVAAMLEERIRQPLTVAGRVLAPLDGPAWQWYLHDDRLVIMLSASADKWQATLSASGAPCSGVGISAGGWGPTIAAALSDARDRYQAAIADARLRMSGLLGEVVS